MRVLRGRLDQGSRRASALAEAALTLELGAGPETLDVLTRAALEVVPGDAALLYTAIPGGGLELVALYGATAALVGRRETAGPLIDTYASGHARVMTGLDAASIASEVPRMRGVIVAPVGLRGDRAIGVLAVLASRRDAFKEAHVEALRTYSAFVAIALSNPLEAPTAATTNLLSV
jgi:GAF domain-containing protein